jgi:L-seryl-tRNA(Ser) seleniumtransferase
VIVGARDAVAKVKSHPLMRALRPDKMTLAALEATLELYRDGVATSAVPALRMLSSRPEELAARANALRERIGAAPPGVTIEVVSIRSAVGGGALPLAEPPSWAIALTARARSPEALDAALRAADPPVVGRIADDRLLLDVRTISDSELDAVAEAVRILRT